MTERFTGKVALVTGATRGIGEHIARRLSSEGAKVAICGRSEAEGTALMLELGGPERALFIQADLSRVEDCQGVVDATVDCFGRLDVLVNNAASVSRGTLEDTTAEQFDAMMAINLRAPFLIMQRALPTFKNQFQREQVGGVIVNIASVNSYVGAPNLMAYSASKGGLVTLSRNLGNSLSPWRIRVHALNVGWTLTDGEKVVQREQEKAPEDWAERIGETRPWGRLLLPEDIAAVACFVASDEARVFSGEVIDLEQFPMWRGAAPKT
jgi:hypothetical protein